MRVLVFGTFDLLHPGHKFVLDEAKKRAFPNGEAGQGELHIVVARDANVEKIKGRAPMESEEERMRTLQEAYLDAKVILGDTEDFLVPVREVEPDLILLGYDQRLPQGIIEKDFPCPVERLEAFEPEKYKSSLKRT